MMKAPEFHRPAAKVGAHLTHLLAHYKADGTVEASRDQERRRASWVALVRRRRA
jgi:hypothetical protein